MYKIALLLPLLFPQEDGSKEALRAFREIEKRIMGAKAARVAFATEMRMKGPNLDVAVSYKGTFLLKAGNKLNIRLKATRDGAEHKQRLLSDGKQVDGNMVGIGNRLANPPKTLHDCARISLARTGIMAGTTLAAMGLHFLGTGENDLKESFVPYEFAMVKAEGGLRVLSYKLDVSGLPGAATVKLWYDPKTYGLAKRTLSWKDETSEGSFTETYSEYTLDPDILDKDFAIPAEK